MILSRTMLHDECVQTLQRHNVPFVAIGRVDDDKVPQVDNDQVGATAAMFSFSDVLSATGTLDEAVTTLGVYSNVFKLTFKILESLLKISLTNSE